MKIKKIETADGSSSLYREDIDETYHSRHGALQEALHVFIDAGLKKVAASKKEITILEVGFGTGLNCLLTAIEAKKLSLKINYLTLETIPLSKEIISGLTYQQLNPEIYSKIHDVEWEKSVEVSPDFFLTKKKLPVQKIDLTSSSVDLIYYDAFGPRAQPEMWTPQVFRLLQKILKLKGIFVTYCAKGQVRRDLEAAGLTMERLAGPPGKREMLRGQFLL